MQDTKRVIGTIDLTPTWAGILPGLIASLQNGTGEGPKIAREELGRLAAFADSVIAERKERAANDDPDFFYWTARLGVHKVWVADGFELTDERALDMLSGDLGYADIGNELSAEVTAAPDLDLIAKEQGYTGSDDPRFIADR